MVRASVLTLFTILGLQPAGCTEPNPDFEGSRDGSTACTPGGRTCSGQNVMVCVPRAGGTGYQLDRACPTASTCTAGICVPSGDACTGICDSGLVCTVFVDPATMISLANFCAKPLGNKLSTSPCATDAECQSGFCVVHGRSQTCYQACGKNRSCPPSMKCADLTLTVNGIRDTIPGCVF